MTLTLVDFFCGAGGSSQGATAVPGVTARLAANHWARAIESHALNFPGTEHFQGDLHDAAVEKFPAGDLFWASPECPAWSSARGRRRDYDQQPDLFGETLPDEAADRSRALMWDVPRYLDAMALRGTPVLAGVVENVTGVRAWVTWREWVASIEKLGYRTRLIAINSMHARPARTPLAPQSRDRLYLAYWLTALGRDPDWDRWLRPTAWCLSCDKNVAAVQWWKRPGSDMGCYRQQYLYRCPHVSCRGQAVEPAALPAAAAIDWSLAGTRIGDRSRPLRPKTIARIEAGLRRYARPVTIQACGADPAAGSRVRPACEPLTMQNANAAGAYVCTPLMVPAGGTWREDAVPVTEPMAARTARENDGLAVPPLLVPVKGRDGKEALPATDPLRTQTAQAETGLAVMPFITVHRGAAGDIRTADIRGPLPSVTAGGNHLGLAVPHGQAAMIVRNNGSRGDSDEHRAPPAERLRALTAAARQSLLTWDNFAHLLVPYYETGVARPVSEPAGTMTATDRFGLASLAVAVEDVLFRMLEPAEIGAAMAFTAGYRVLGSKRERVRQYGNAVTPPVAEVIIGALVEAITGEEVTRA
jgi:DNA (cytosine-5)-methyltransferase 1